MYSLGLSALLGFCLLLAQNVSSAVITFDGYSKLHTYRTSGLYNMVGLGFWNGSPVSENNMPSISNRRLESSISLWASQASPNVLFFQVHDVVTTYGASWWGTAFLNVTQTGIRFTLPDELASQPTSFSSSYANPGQIRAYGGSYESTEVMTETYGYALEKLGENDFLISSSNFGFNGFTSLYQIRGTSRIRGGGVFALEFPSGISVFGHDYSRIGIEAEYGEGNQFIGRLPSASGVPEPSSTFPVILLAFALTATRREIRTK